MKRLLTEVYGFLDTPACLTILTEKGDLCLYPTQKNVLAAMRWLVEGSRAGDILFFHFSGHGGQKRNLKVRTMFENSDFVGN